MPWSRSRRVKGGVSDMAHVEGSGRSLPCGYPNSRVSWCPSSAPWSRPRGVSGASVTWHTLRAQGGPYLVGIPTGGSPGVPRWHCGLGQGGLGGHQ